MKIKFCKVCSSPWHYQTFCPQKKTKRPKPLGRSGLEYKEWRDTVAMPYLDKKFGHVCSVEGCFITNPLDVDHIVKRGSHAELKVNLNNVRYLCRPHHQAVT